MSLRSDLYLAYKKNEIITLNELLLLHLGGLKKIIKKLFLSISLVSFPNKKYHFAHFKHKTELISCLSLRPTKNVN